jgi:excisionase family DNA binding protein
VLQLAAIDTSDDYLRAGEAATILNVSPKTVSRWADQGRIAHIVTLGGHRRFSRAEIDRIARVMTGDDLPG